MKLRLTDSGNLPAAPPSHDSPEIDWPHKRQFPRHAVAARCWVSDADHTAYLRMHDLSLGGLSISAALPFTPQSEIELRLELPAGTVRARGEVVWRGGQRMGARFTEILEGRPHLEALLGNP